MNSVFPVNFLVRNKPTVKNKHLSEIKSQDLSGPPSNPVHVREKPVEPTRCKTDKIYSLYHFGTISFMLLSS